ncbi:MAG: toxin-antitoxin system YwqK family antitoxin [Chlamydiales bacterium]
MKKSFVLLLLATTAFTISCRSGQYNNEVVKETYIHKYGVPIPKSDWNKQGKDGKIVQLRRDGVTVSRSYAKGVMHGECTFTYPNTSTLHKTELYENGVLVGKKANYPNGLTLSEETFENELISKRNYWYEDGAPQTVESYTDGLLTNGEYHSPNNIVEARVKGGEGTRVIRNEEGVLVARESFEKSHRIERVDYFPNGDPQSITPYLNNHIHGTRLTFCQGGLPNSVEQWNHGLQEGTTMVYMNGEKVSELPYVRGKREGIEKRFRDGAILVEEVTWKEDKQHGPCKIYSDGTSRTDYYHEGALVNKPTYERLNPPHQHA